MKKTKFMTRLAAVVFALAILFAMSVPAWAAPADLAGDGIVGDFQNPDTPVVQSDGTVLLYKEITAYNPENCTVNAPTITYTYTIEPGSADMDIYDIKTAHDPEANAHVKTKAGVGTPTILGTVDGGSNWTNGTLVFTPAVQLTASSAGTVNKNDFKIKVDFSGIQYEDTSVGSGAGVYRYVITEHVNSATTTTDDTTQKNAAGIAEGTISNIRYMDVYVDGNGDIYGYVCFAYNNNIDAQDTPTTTTVAQAYKTEGFTAGSDTSTSPATAVTADSYSTFNFEVTKNVVNDQYAINTHHEFPFNIKLDNAHVTAAVLPIRTLTDDVTAATPTYGTTASYVHDSTTLSAAAIGTGNSATVWTPTISHHTSVKYVGIPCGTTVTIHETNDVTGVTYTSSVTNSDGTVANKNIDTNAVSNDAVINCTNHVTNATENHTASASKAITFTNTLLQISPTGLAFRIAPYALMLAAGVSLIVLFIKRKHEATDMI